jgi:predicted AAA+ superfamily ATPase
MARVDDRRDGPTGFEKYFCKLKRLKARHKIANQIKELKTSVMVASERHKRYEFAQNPSTSSVDPRLQALYTDIDKLVGIDGPKKHIIELLSMEMNGPSTKLKVVSIAGCGGLGKTTLAKQVYDTIKGQFSCSAFVSVSRTLDLRKILIHISSGVGFTGYTQDDGEQQLIDKIRNHLHCER